MGLECCQVTRRFCKLDLMVTLFEINLGKKKNLRHSGRAEFPQMLESVYEGKLHWALV